MKKNLTTAIKQSTHLADLWLPLKIKFERTPGISWGIVYGGKLVYAKSFGVGDLKTSGGLDEHSLFHIASISKTFTAVAILQLQEKNKLKLDDKISKYLPWFVGKSKKGNLGNVTIRELLSHLAGVFRDGNTPHWVTGDFPKNIQVSFSNQVKILKNKAGFKYSNYGFSVLGMVIESVTGGSYDKYVQENIFEKLGMKDTSTDYDPRKNVVIGHGREIVGEEQEQFAHHKANAFAPATGYVSSVADMAKFAAALSFSHKGVQILSPVSKKLLSKVQTKTEDGDKYGLGVDVMNISKHKVIGHSGGYPGHNTQFLIDQELGLGVVVLTNSTRGSAHPIARGLIDSVYRVSDRPADYKSKIKTSYSRYEGLYRNLWGDSLIVGVGDILISLSPGTSVPLKYKTSLIPQKESNLFLMKTYSVFSERDEMANFGDFKNDKAQTVTFGPTPSKRVG